MTGDTGSDEAAEPAAGEGEEDVPRPRHTGFRVAVALAVAFGLLAALMAVVAAGLQDDLEAERAGSGAEVEARQSVAETAGAFSEALLSYRFDELDEARDRVLALSTGAFAEEYESAFSGLSAMIGEARSSARATVKDIFVGDVENGRAEAITVVDADVEGASGRRDILDAYIRLVLVRVDGRWLVDGVTSLNFTPATSAAGPAPEPPSADEPG